MGLVWILLASTALAQNVAPTAAPSAREVMRAAMEQQRAAVSRQRESVRKQSESVGVTLLVGGDMHAGGTGDLEPVVAPAPAGDAASQMPCDPIADLEIAPIIDIASREQNLEAKLLRAVIQQESGFHPCAVSPKGAKGLMQLMPDTAQQLGVKDPFNAQENVAAGAKYLKQLLDKYKGDVSQALGAYNAGPATVDQAGGVPNIRETRDYVKSIMQKVGPTRTDPPSIPPPKPIGN
ncbi:MAG TPA: lytic transglycosylase domain-containing protein [Bryobacteraceae bacterium]